MRGASQRTRFATDFVWPGGTTKMLLRTVTRGLHLVGSDHGTLWVNLHRSRGTLAGVYHPCDLVLGVAVVVSGAGLESGQLGGVSGGPWWGR